MQLRGAMGREISYVPSPSLLPYLFIYRRLTSRVSPRPREQNGTEARRLFGGNDSRIASTNLSIYFRLIRVTCLWQKMAVKIRTIIRHTPILIEKQRDLSELRKKCTRRKRIKYLSYVSIVEDVFRSFAKVARKGDRPP